MVSIWRERKRVYFIFDCSRRINDYSMKFSIGRFKEERLLLHSLFSSLLLVCVD